MCNLEELKKCRIVKYINHYYLVGYNSDKWLSLDDGGLKFVDDSCYRYVSVAYKNWVDFKNDKPFYIKDDVLLSNTLKEWLKYIVRSLKNIVLETLELEVFNDYCNINFELNDGENDFITLPNFENIIYDFSKLEKDKVYTFKELGIKL